jgi:hypothetical protein
LGDRGLVVITSCGHGGIINTLRRAQEMTGIDKIYALVGGFYLAPAPSDYLGKPELFLGCARVQVKNRIPHNRCSISFSELGGASASDLGPRRSRKTVKAKFK